MQYLFSCCNFISGGGKQASTYTASALDLELVISLKINLSSRNLPRDLAKPHSQSVRRFPNARRNLGIYDGLQSHNFHCATASPAFSRKSFLSPLAQQKGSPQEIYQRPWNGHSKKDIAEVHFQRNGALCTCRQSKRFVLRESLWREL